MARSQPTNEQPGGSSNNLPPSLKALLSQNPNLKTSKVPGIGGNTAKASDTAGIYATKEVPALKPLLLSLDPALKITEGHSGDTTHFTCVWPKVTVRFTVQSHWNSLQQRLGMKNWIAGVAGGGTNTPAVESLLRKVDGTVACIGSVITPRYDSAGKASALVLGLAAKLDGYVFSEQSFYDPSGDKIVGTANAPAKLTEIK